MDYRHLCQILNRLLELRGEALQAILNVGVPTFAVGTISTRLVSGDGLAAMSLPGIAAA